MCWLSSDGYFEGIAISQTEQEVGTGLFGDGFAVAYAPPSAVVVVRSSLIAASEREGPAAFAATIAVDSTDLSCNSIDLNAQSLADAPSWLEDLGGNACGCGAERRTCQVLRTELEPPGAIEN